eukprot:35977-Eustigmatos_ZCMA.PRE.1
MTRQVEKHFHDQGGVEVLAVGRRYWWGSWKAPYYYMDVWVDSMKMACEVHMFKTVDTERHCLHVNIDGRKEI